MTSDSPDASAQLPPHSPYGGTEGRGRALRLAMWIFLGSEGLLFAGLFALFYGYRSHYPAAFDHGVEHNLMWNGTANTFILLVSSFFVAYATHVVREENYRIARLCLALTVLLGLAFFGLKLYEYAEHIHKGLLPGASYSFQAIDTRGIRLFFALYWTMTGLHALHLAVGCTWLSWVWWRLGHAPNAPGSRNGMELSALYWHLIDVIWIFLWPMLYLK